MVPSLPPRFQFAGVPSGWLRLLPVSKVEFAQKLPDTSGVTRATDRSSMIITPVRVPGPPETSEQRIFTALGGTSMDPLRFVNVEFAMVLTQPALVVPLVTKWVSPTTLSVASKKSTVRRISVALRLYISNHWIFNVSPGLALPLRRTSEYHSP